MDDFFTEISDTFRILPAKFKEVMGYTLKFMGKFILGIALMFVLVYILSTINLAPIGGIILIIFLIFFIVISFMFLNQIYQIYDPNRNYIGSIILLMIASVILAIILRILGLDGLLGIIISSIAVIMLQGYILFKFKSMEKILRYGIVCTLVNIIFSIITDIVAVILGLLLFGGSLTMFAIGSSGTPMFIITFLLFVIITIIIVVLLESLQLSFQISYAIVIRDGVMIKRNLNSYMNMDNQSSNMGQGMQGQAPNMGQGMQGQAPNMGQGMQGQAPNMGQGMQGQAPNMGQGMQGQTPNMGQGMQGQAPNMGQGMQGQAPNMGQGMQGQTPNMGQGMQGQTANMGQGMQGQAPNMGQGMQGQTPGQGMQGQKANNNKTK